jgi:peroxiredoxin
VQQLTIGDHAPDFELPDHLGQLIRLSEANKSKNVVLVFNIGFA